MSVFDRFYDKEKLIRKTVEIDNDLYDKLSEILKGKYNTSVNMLINASIEELIKTENINLYAKEDKYSTMKRSLLIKESFSNPDGLSSWFQSRPPKGILSFAI